MDAELAARLKSHVNVLAGLIGARYPKKPSTMEAAAAYIARQFEEMGDAVSRQRYLARDVEVSNLVVERKGAGAAMAGGPRAGAGYTGEITT